MGVFGRDPKPQCERKLHAGKGGGTKRKEKKWNRRKKGGERGSVSSHTPPGTRMYLGVQVGNRTEGRTVKM